VLNPATPVDVLDWVLPELDHVLLMSVNPGFGGQSFIPSTLEKLRVVRGMIDRCGKPVRLEIDGGVKPDNIGEIAAAGADTFVAGSAIFGQRDYAAVIASMKAAVAAVRQSP
jgi:ribulose-phosphate 3-epimerase